MYIIHLSIWMPFGLQSMKCIGDALNTSCQEDKAPSIRRERELCGGPLLHYGSSLLFLSLIFKVGNLIKYHVVISL